MTQATAAVSDGQEAFSHKGLDYIFRPRSIAVLGVTIRPHGAA